MVNYSNTYLSYLIMNYKNIGAVIDTNIMLLYFIGQYDINLIEKFERTDTFTKEEFKILKNIINKMKEIKITPNILTEINNFTKRMDNNYYDTFRTITKDFNEQYFSTKKLCSNEFFYKFDITDISILEIAKMGYLVITNDKKLVGLIRSLKLDVLYWYDIKNLIWQDILSE